MLARRRSGATAPQRPTARRRRCDPRTGPRSGRAVRDPARHARPPDPRTTARTDAAVLDVLAAAAGIAIDCVDRRAQVDELATFTDRERIARDLHDTVIQRLFAIGLSLEGVVPGLPEDLGERVARTVVDIDSTIRRIRATIFDLETRRGDTSTVRRRVLDRCVDARAQLGSDPIVGFEGPVDTAVDAGDHRAPARGARRGARQRGASTRSRARRGRRRRRARPAGAAAHGHRRRSRDRTRR